MIGFLVNRTLPKQAFLICFLLVVGGHNSSSREEVFQVVPIHNDGPGQRAQKYVAFVPPGQ